MAEKKEHIPIWLLYTVTVIFGLAFSITIFFVVWNNALNSKHQEYLIDTLTIRESVKQNITTVEQGIENLALLATTGATADNSYFKALIKRLTEKNDFILAAGCLLLSESEIGTSLPIQLSSNCESLNFDFQQELIELFSSEVMQPVGQVFNPENTTIISSRANQNTDQRIWMFRPVNDGDQTELVFVVVDASTLLAQTAISQNTSIAIYSESSGLLGRQLLYRNKNIAESDDWKVTEFVEQSNLQVPSYSIRLEFSKPVFWNEIEQGLIITSLIIGAGVTLLLVALVRARDLQARELRQRNIVIEKKVEEQTQELAVARDKALDASRMKSDFLASMSHEIRTPLNAIIGMSELLSETSLTGEQKKYINIFRKAGDTLLSLVNDILDLSKIEAHQLVLEEISFDLRETIEESVDIYAVKASEKNIELAARIKPGTPTRRIGDPTRLRQIILNLISNALKFTESGEIIVTVESQNSDEDSDYVQFAVSDTGIGIPEEKRQQIFASFTQVDSSTTRKYGGTGLGLTISKSLTTMMDGRIWVESEEGEGSTFLFNVRLPRDTEVTEISGRYNIERDLKGKRILVVDDNSTNRLILRENLVALGAEVIEAENGKHALEQIESSTAGKHPFDLGLIDCRMPELDGFQLAEAMRENGINLDKILMISSADLSKDMQKAKELSLGAYLVKPVKRADLLQIINRKLFDSDSEEREVDTNAETDTDQTTLSGSILLVEDNPDNRLLIKAYLKKTDYTITEAENGQIAVDLFRENDFDLVFMDVQMPIMDGHEATRQIRGYELDHKEIRTPIIALTAHAIKEEIDKCIAAGCDTHIGKPVKKATLLQTLEKYI